MKSFSWPDSHLEFSCNTHQVDHTHPAYCCLDWMKDHCVTDTTLSEYYAHAADKIIENRLSKYQSNLDDGLFMPITYLYRHSIELNIKEIIRLYISYGEIQSSNKILRTHSLSKLWRLIEHLLQDLVSKHNADWVENVSSFLKNLDTCDPEGTSMRYSRSSSGVDSSDSFPATINLINLKSSVAAVNNFLRASLDYLRSQNNS